MKQNKRKAFTLVELLIVIAILAILATVSIIGYTSIMKKAYISNDSALVEQMNLILQGNETLDNKARNMSEAVQQCQDNGFVIENLEPQTQGYRFIYDQANNRFSLVDDEFVVVATDENKPVTINTEEGQENLDIFIVVEDEEDLALANEKLSSVFLGINYSEVSFTYSRGIDAGKNITCKTLVYENNTDSSTKHEGTVIVRTNNFQNLNVKAYNKNNECDTVYHYGDAGSLIVESNGNNSVHEFGSALYLEAPLGAVEFGEGSVIDVLVVEANEASVDVTIGDGAQVGTLIIKTNASLGTDVTIEDGAFVREIIVAGADGEAEDPIKNLTLNVEEGATIKASTINNSDDSSVNDNNKDTSISGIPDTTAKALATSQCSEHDWATSENSNVQFCKNCGARRTTTTIQNDATTETTVTETYERSVTYSNDVNEYANSLITQVEQSKDIEAKSIYEDTSSETIEVEKDKETGETTTTKTDENGTTSETIGSTTTHTHSWTYTNNGNGTHTATCTSPLCGTSKTQNCTFVLSSYNATESGDNLTKTYKCNKCGYTKTEKMTDSESAAKGFIAKITGTTYDKGYKTFEDAIDAADSQSVTITLLDDVDLTKYTEDGSLNAGYIIDLTDDVLDLNGHTITSKNHGVDYSANGNGCTIKNGTFVCDNNGSYGLCLAYSEGQIVVDGITVNGGINVHDCDNVIINNSKVYGTKYYAIWVEYGSNVTINSGTYTSTSTLGNAVFDTEDNHKCKLTINGGKIVADGDNVVIARNDVMFSTNSTATCNKNPGDEFVDKPYGFVENNGVWSVAANVYKWIAFYTTQGGTSNFATQAEAVTYKASNPENCYVDGEKMPLYLDYSQSTKASSEISISDKTTYYSNGSAMTAEEAFDDISTSSGWGTYGISNGYIYKKVANTTITQYFKTEADADAYVAQHSGATKEPIN